MSVIREPTVNSAKEVDGGKGSRGEFSFPWGKGFGIEKRISLRGGNRQWCCSWLVGGCPQDCQSSRTGTLPLNGAVLERRLASLSSIRSTVTEMKLICEQRRGFPSCTEYWQGVGVGGDARGHGWTFNEWNGKKSVPGIPGAFHQTSLAIRSLSPFVIGMMKRYHRYPRPSSCLSVNWTMEWWFFFCNDGGKSCKGKNRSVVQRKREDLKGQFDGSEEEGSVVINYPPSNGK